MRLLWMKIAGADIDEVEVTLSQAGWVCGGLAQITCDIGLAGAMVLVEIRREKANIPLRVENIQIFVFCFPEIRGCLRESLKAAIFLHSFLLVRLVHEKRVVLDIP